MTQEKKSHPDLLAWHALHILVGLGSFPTDQETGAIVDRLRAHVAGMWGDMTPQRERDFLSAVEALEAARAEMWIDKDKERITRADLGHKLHDALFVSSDHLRREVVPENWTVS